MTCSGLPGTRTPVAAAATAATVPLARHEADEEDAAPGPRTPDYHGLGYVNKRPAFGQWLKATWTDILVIFMLGTLALGVGAPRPCADGSA